MRLVQRESGILAQHHRKIECRPTERHQQIELTDYFCQPTGIQGSIDWINFSFEYRF